MYVFPTTTEEYSKLAYAALLYATTRSEKMRLFVQDVIIQNVPNILEEYLDKMYEIAQEKFYEDDNIEKEEKLNWMRFLFLCPTQERDVPNKFNEPADCFFESADSFWLFILSSMRYDYQMLPKGENLAKPITYAEIMDRNQLAMTRKWINNYVKDLKKLDSNWDVVKDALRRANQSVIQMEQEQTNAQ